MLTNALSEGLLEPGIVRDENLQKAVLSDSAKMQSLVSFVQENPWRRSAELNAMRPYLEANTVKRVFIVSTASAACRIAADVLEAVFTTSFGIPVAGKLTQVFYGDQEQQFSDSLLRLWESILDIIRRHKSDNEQFLINATGGLKPELAVCLLAGNLTLTPVYYKHEHFQQTVQLPFLVAPLVPQATLNALRELYESNVPLSGPAAQKYFEEHNGSELERLHLIRVERQGKTVYRVMLASYGKLLCELDRTQIPMNSK
jgi:putative CRISPR-associated protein (TIGR02619 family)